LLRNRAFAADYAHARERWRNGLSAVFPGRHLLAPPVCVCAGARDLNRPHRPSSRTTSRRTTCRHHRPADAGSRHRVRPAAGEYAGTAAVSVIAAQLTAAIEDTAEMVLKLARKNITDRKGMVLAFAYATREALDELSPDERSRMLRMIAGVPDPEHGGAGPGNNVCLRSATCAAPAPAFSSHAQAERALQLLRCQRQLRLVEAFPLRGRACLAEVAEPKKSARADVLEAVPPATQGESASSARDQSADLGHP
jgi:hypothetical protein